MLQTNAYVNSIAVSYWILLTALATMLCVPQITTSNNNGWEAKWLRTKLTDKQKETAASILADLIKSKKIADLRKNQLQDLTFDEKLPNGEPHWIPQDTTHFNIYKDIAWKQEGKRAEPLCRMIFWRTTLDEKKHFKDWQEFSTCSCAFIKETVILLSAHCFFNKGITPETWNVGFVVPQYGIMGDNPKNHAKHMSKNARVIAEWWYPAGYLAPKKDVPPYKNAYWDIAFIKIDRAIDGLKTFYTMALPWMSLADTASPDFYNLAAPGSKLIALGYPDDYKGGEVAVNFKGTSVLPMGEGGRNVLGLMGKEQRQGNVTPAKEKMVKAAEKPSVRQAMTSGSSGGPWIANEDELALAGKNARVRLEMAVVSVSSTGCGPKDNCKNMSGPVFTPRVLEAARLIRAKKVSDPISEGDGTSQVVTLSLTTTDEVNAEYEFP